jgi:hypothetical protein
VTDASGDTNRIQTVSDQTRTWTYGYHGITGSVSLDQVTLPDNSTWQLGEVDNLLTDPQYPNDPPACLERIAPIASSLTATLQHPSGASGTFTLKPTEHGRSDVQQWCMDKSLLTPIFYFTNSLTDKTISGPGLSPMTWRYDYGPGNGSFAPCNDCVTSTTVSVTDPRGMSRAIPLATGISPPRARSFKSTSDGTAILPCAPPATATGRPTPDPISCRTAPAKKSWATARATCAIRRWASA